MAVPRSFSPRALRWLIGGACASFVLAILLTAFGDSLGGPLSAGPDTFSYSALGHRAFFSLLSRSGLTTLRRRSERVEAPPPGALLVAAEPRVEPADGTTNRERFTRLLSRAWVTSSRLLVVLPKREGLADPSRPRWLADVRPAGIEAAREVLRLLRWDGEGEPELDQLVGEKTLSCTTAWGEEISVTVRSLRLIRRGSGFEPVVRCGEGLLVARHVPEEGPSAIYVLSDPDIINNQGLGRADHAILAHALVAREIDPTLVMFDESIHGFAVGGGILSELFRYPLNLAAAHGGVLVGLLLWSGMGRLGRPRPAAPALAGGKMTLIETTAALMELRSSPAETLPEYFRQTVRSVAAHCMLPQDLPQSRLLARLRTLARARGVPEDIGRLREEIGRMRAGRGRSARALELARRLHRWRRGMLDVA